MAKRSDFERVWVPRIGKHAADEMFYYYQLATFGSPAAALFAAAGGGLIGRGGSVGSVLGPIFVGLTALYMVSFVVSRLRIRNALSSWFGVKLSDIPKSTRRFDAWAAARHLKSPEERAAEAAAVGTPETPSEAAPGASYDQQE